MIAGEATDAPMDRIIQPIDFSLCPADPAPRRIAIVACPSLLLFAARRPVVRDQRLREIR
jgi:hypothetical protein